MMKVRDLTWILTTNTPHRRLSNHLRPRRVIRLRLRQISSLRRAIPRHPRLAILPRLRRDISLAFSRRLRLLRGKECPSLLWFSVSAHWSSRTAA